MLQKLLFQVKIPKRDMQNFEFLTPRLNAIQLFFWFIRFDI